MMLCVCTLNAHVPIAQTRDDSTLMTHPERPIVSTKAQRRIKVANFKSQLTGLKVTAMHTVRRPRPMLSILEAHSCSGEETQAYFMNVVAWYGVKDETNCY